MAIVPLPDPSKLLLVLFHGLGILVLQGCRRSSLVYAIPADHSLGNKAALLLQRHVNKTVQIST